MAVCERCNTKLSFTRAYMWGERLCESCEREIHYEEAKRIETAERERVQGMADAKASTLTELVSNGHDMFMFRSVYVPVDSVLDNKCLNGSFDISGVQSLGLEGWEMAGIVPKTVGVITAGREAGCGGNVVGVYFIMKKRVSQAEPLLAERISEYVHSLPDWVKTGERHEDEAGL